MLSRSCRLCGCRDIVSFYRPWMTPYSICRIFPISCLCYRLQQRYKHSLNQSMKHRQHHREMDLDRDAWLPHLFQLRCGDSALKKTMVCPDRQGSRASIFSWSWRDPQQQHDCFCVCIQRGEATGPWLSWVSVLYRALHPGALQCDGHNNQHSGTLAALELNCHCHGLICHRS